MHSLIHVHYARQATPSAEPRSRAENGQVRAKAPPGRLRSHAARALVRIAARLDAESGRRAPAR